MNLLRSVFRSSASLHPMTNNGRSLPWFFTGSLRFFSAEGEQPPQVSSSATEHDATVNQFIKASEKGFAYGRIMGISRNTMKSDVISLLEKAKLTEDDVKVSYSRSFFPLAMLVRFRSPSVYGEAVRTIRNLPFYKLERVEASQWDILKPYNGRTVLLQGIPQNALPEDVERFLSGCEYDPSSIQLSPRQGLAGSKMALVHFPSQTQAMNTLITKNRRFCLNSHITVRVLH